MNGSNETGPKADTESEPLKVIYLRVPVGLHERIMEQSKKFNPKTPRRNLNHMLVELLESVYGPEPKLGALEGKLVDDAIPETD